MRDISEKLAEDIDGGNIVATCARMEAINAKDADAVIDYIEEAIENDEIDQLTAYMQSIGKRVKPTAIDTLIKAIDKGKRKLVKACIDDAIDNDIPLAMDYIKALVDNNDLFLARDYIKAVVGKNSLELFKACIERAVDHKNLDELFLAKLYIQTAINEGSLESVENYIDSAIADENIDGIIKARLEVLKAYIEGATSNKRNPYRKYVDKAQLAACMLGALINGKSTIKSYINGAVRKKDTNTVITFINEVIKNNERDRITTVNYHVDNDRSHIYMIYQLNCSLIRRWPTELLLEVQENTNYFFTGSVLEDLIAKKVYNSPEQTPPPPLELIEKLISIGTYISERAIKLAIDRGPKIFDLMLKHRCEDLLERDISYFFTKKTIAERFTSLIHPLITVYNSWPEGQQNKIDDIAYTIEEFLSKKPIAPTSSRVEIVRNLKEKCKMLVLCEVIPNLREFSIDKDKLDLHSPKNASYLRSLEILYNTTDVEQITNAIWEDLRRGDFLKHLKNTQSTHLTGSAYLYRDLFFQMLIGDESKLTSAGLTLNNFHKKTVLDLFQIAKECGYGPNVWGKFIRSIVDDETLHPEKFGKLLEDIIELDDDTWSSYYIGKLVGKGLDPNMELSGGKSALQLAFEKNKQNSAKALILHGANPNTKFSDRKTALQLAFEKNKQNLAKHLIIQEANPNIKFSDGKTAVQLAFENNDLCILEILLEKGADFRIAWDGKTFLEHLSTPHTPSLSDEEYEEEYEYEEEHECEEEYEYEEEASINDFIKQVENSINKKNQKEFGLLFASFTVASHLVATYAFNFNVVTAVNTLLYGQSIASTTGVLCALYSIPTLLLIGGIALALHHCITEYTPVISYVEKVRTYTNNSKDLSNPDGISI
jgi:hypothetical protein